MVVGVAWYSREQWARLREVASDPDSLENTYDEWITVARSTLRELAKAGAVAEKIDVDVEEIVAWCNKHGRPIDGAARSHFAAERLRQKHQGS